MPVYSKFLEMSRKRTICLTALVLAVLMAAPLPVRAEARQTQDYFIGTGAAGPYTLSWKNILAGSEKVELNGLPLTWGVDYTIDPAAGTLTFTNPLPAQDGVTVQYVYDIKLAQPQSSGLSLPLSLALNDNVSMSALYNHAPTDGTNPGALNLGLNGGWQVANDTKVATHLMFAPALTGTDAQAGPNGMDRIGLAASGQTQIGKPLQVTFGFSRAGLGLGKLGSDNWQAGLQKLNLGSAFTPSRLVQATFGYTQTDSTTGKGPAQSQINAALALTPSSALRLQTSIAQTEGGGSGPAQNLDLKAALTEKKIALTADAGQATASGVGTTQTLNAAVIAKPSDKTELDATFAQKDAPGAGNDNQNLDLKAAINSGKVLSLTADTSQVSTGSSGTTQSLAAAAVVKPSSKTELDATFSQKDAPGTDNDTQALNLKAALTPSKTVSVTASMAQSSQGTQDSSSQDIHLSVAPRSTLQVNTDLSVQKNPTADTQVAAVDGKAQPFAFLMVSGGYQWRTVTPVQSGGAVTGDYDSSSAQFTLAPPKAAVHVIGTYAQNPTDTNGNLQHQAQHGLSLETTIGALKLTTGYNWSQQYDTASTGTSLHIGLGLRVSANTQFTGDYKQDLTGLGLDPTGATAYSVGLTRNLGDAFNLSLSGTVQQSVGPTPPTPSNVTANANLGMKF